MFSVLRLSTICAVVLRVAQACNPNKFAIASFDNTGFSQLNLFYRSPTGALQTAGCPGQTTNTNSYLQWTLGFSSNGIFNTIATTSDFAATTWLEPAGARILAFFQDTSGNIRAYFYNGNNNILSNLIGNAPIGASIAASTHTDPSGAHIVSVYWLNGTTVFESTFSSASEGSPTFSTPIAVITNVMSGSSLSATFTPPTSTTGLKNVFAQTQSSGQVGVWTAAAGSFGYGGPLLTPDSPVGTAGFAAVPFTRGTTQQLLYGLQPTNNAGQASIQEYFQATNLVWTDGNFFDPPANSAKLAAAQQTTNGQQTILVYYTNSTGLIQRTWSTLNGGGNWFNPFVIPC